MSVSDYSSSSQWTTEDEEVVVDPKLSKKIAIKSAIVLVTSIVGAVLALLINVFMEVKTASPQFSRTSYKVELDLEGHQLTVGQFRNRKDPKLCLDTWDRPTETSKDHQVVTLWPCHPFFAYNQNFAFTKKGELKQSQNCLEMIDDVAEMVPCRREYEGQFWVWLQGDMLYNPQVKTCLGIGGLSEKNDYRFMVSKRCNKSDDGQRWIYEPTEIDKMWSHDDHVNVDENLNDQEQYATTAFSTTHDNTTCTYDFFLF